MFFLRATALLLWVAAVWTQCTPSLPCDATNYGVVGLGLTPPGSGICSTVITDYCVASASYSAFDDIDYFPPDADGPCNADPAFYKFFANPGCVTSVVMVLPPPALSVTSLYCGSILANELFPDTPHYVFDDRTGTLHCNSHLGGNAAYYPYTTPCTTVLDCEQVDQGEFNQACIQYVTCNAGVCMPVYKSIGSPCDDRDDCTVQDSCSLHGVCVGKSLNAACQEMFGSECVDSVCVSNVFPTGGVPDLNALCYTTDTFKYGKRCGNVVQCDAADVAAGVCSVLGCVSVNFTAPGMPSLPYPTQDPTPLPNLGTEACFTGIYSCDQYASFNSVDGNMCNNGTGTCVADTCPMDLSEPDMEVSCPGESYFYGMVGRNGSQPFYYTGAGLLASVYAALPWQEVVYQSTLFPNVRDGSPTWGLLTYAPGQLSLTDYSSYYVYADDTVGIGWQRRLPLDPLSWVGATLVMGLAMQCPQPVSNLDNSYVLCTAYLEVSGDGIDFAPVACLGNLQYIYEQTAKTPHESCVFNYPTISSNFIFTHGVHDLLGGSKMISINLTPRLSKDMVLRVMFYQRNVNPSHSNQNPAMSAQITAFDVEAFRRCAFSSSATDLQTGYDLNLVCVAGSGTCGLPSGNRLCSQAFGLAQEFAICHPQYQQADEEVLACLDPSNPCVSRVYNSTTHLCQKTPVVSAQCPTGTGFPTVCTRPSAFYAGPGTAVGGTVATLHGYLYEVSKGSLDWTALPYAELGDDALPMFGSVVYDDTVDQLKIISQQGYLSLGQGWLRAIPFDVGVYEDVQVSITLQLHCAAVLVSIHPDGLLHSFSSSPVGCYTDGDADAARQLCTMFYPTVIDPIATTSIGAGTTTLFFYYGAAHMTPLTHISIQYAGTEPGSPCGSGALLSEPFFVNITAVKAYGNQRCFSGDANQCISASSCGISTTAGPSTACAVGSAITCPVVPCKTTLCNTLNGTCESVADPFQEGAVCVPDCYSSDPMENTCVTLASAPGDGCGQPECDDAGTCLPGQGGSRGAQCPEVGDPCILWNRPLCDGNGGCIYASEYPDDPDSVSPSSLVCSDGDGISCTVGKCVGPSGSLGLFYASRPVVCVPMPGETCADLADTPCKTATCDGEMCEVTINEGMPCVYGDIGSEMTGFCTASGQCEIPDPSCDDGNPCTLDYVDQDTLMCVNEEVDEMSCDLDACNTGGYCSSGNCVGTEEDTCDDGNECTDDYCDLNTGCYHEVDVGASCEGLFYTETSLALNGNFTGYNADSPNDNPFCATPAQLSCCDATGQCVGTALYLPVPFDYPCVLLSDPCSNPSRCFSHCSDTVDAQPVFKNGIPCDGGYGMCSNGKCCLNVDDDDSTCDSVCVDTPCNRQRLEGGVCVDYPVDVGMLCDDGDVCTIGGYCDGAGNCTEIAVDPLLFCPTPPNDCHEYTCVSGQGCFLEQKSYGTPCDDGDECTTGDICDNGFCTATPVHCPQPNSTFQQAICSPGMGCILVPLSGPCDDNNTCTEYEYCVNGTVTVSAALVCDYPASNCTADGSCDDGVCDYSANNGIPCMFNGTAVGFCNHGVCADPDTCDDQNVCTIDTPIIVNGTVVGCNHTVVVSGCDDGLFCTIDDTCQPNGQCRGTYRTDCPDGGECEIGYCSPGTDSCNVIAVDGTICNLDDKCTISHCVSGACIGEEVNCDALSNQCLTGICNSTDGSCYASANVGWACMLTDQCVLTANCDSFGRCVETDYRDCVNVSNSCTSDATCDPFTGLCVYPMLGGSCDDGLLCTEGDTCVAVEGETEPQCMGIPVVCPPSDNQCVDNSQVMCNETHACVYPLRISELCVGEHSCGTFVCDNVGDCMMNETVLCPPPDMSLFPNITLQCILPGVCDFNSSGCIYEPVPDNATLSCDDGDACTVDDVCVGGKCVGTPINCYEPTNSSVAGLCNVGASNLVCVEGECMSNSTSPCPDDGVYCNGVEEIASDSFMCESIDIHCELEIGPSNECLYASCVEPFGCTLSQLPIVGQPCSHPSVGECASSHFTCTLVMSDFLLGCFEPYTPTAEVCGNGKDDNCNGLVDEHCSQQICSSVASCAPPGPCYNVSCESSAGYIPPQPADDDDFMNGMATLDDDEWHCYTPGSRYCTIWDDDDGSKVNYCVYTALPLSTPCNTTDPCMQPSGMCSAPGLCLADPIDCDDALDYTHDFCQPVNGTGTCFNEYIVGYPCDDGDNCTHSDAYVDTAGTCAGVPITCDACNPCVDTQCVPDQVRPQGYRCEFTPKAMGTPCDDNNVCTEDDVCDGVNTCQGSPVMCTPSVVDSGCQMSVCVASNNTGCVDVEVSDGSACIQSLHALQALEAANASVCVANRCTFDQLHAVTDPEFCVYPEDSRNIWIGEMIMAVSRARFNLHLCGSSAYASNGSLVAPLVNLTSDVPVTLRVNDQDRTNSTHDWIARARTLLFDVGHSCHAYAACDTFYEAVLLLRESLHIYQELLRVSECPGFAEGWGIETVVAHPRSAYSGDFWLTIAFEDRGDRDFDQNDFIVSWNVVEGLDASNQSVATLMTYEPLARGSPAPSRFLWMPDGTPCPGSLDTPVSGSFASPGDLFVAELRRINSFTGIESTAPEVHLNASCIEIYADTKAVFPSNPTPNFANVYSAAPRIKSPDTVELLASVVHNTPSPTVLDEYDVYSNFLAPFTRRFYHMLDVTNDTLGHDASMTVMLMSAGSFTVLNGAESLYQGRRPEGLVLPCSWKWMQEHIDISNVYSQYNSLTQAITTGSSVYLPLTGPLAPWWDVLVEVLAPAVLFDA